ncbi:hypothetical protein WH47_10555, partial [Habropoda laboriosa]
KHETQGRVKGTSTSPSVPRKSVCISSRVSSRSPKDTLRLSSIERERDYLLSSRRGGFDRKRCISTDMTAASQ